MVSVTLEKRQWLSISIIEGFWSGARKSCNIYSTTHMLSKFFNMNFTHFLEMLNFIWILNFHRLQVATRSVLQTESVPVTGHMQAASSPNPLVPVGRQA
jgi:hypothetical protein